jgi:hypothetical protein
LRKLCVLAPSRLNMRIVLQSSHLGPARSWCNPLPELKFLDDGKGKPVGIQEQIGKRPVFTAGNSDGDYEMLQWTTTGTGYPRFGMIVHHTDSVREWAYDRKSHIGHLERGLDDAAKYNWQIVDMKNDWKEIFSYE